LLIKFLSKNKNSFSLNEDFICRHLTDDETRKTKTQLLIDSYQYYSNAIIDRQQSEIDSSENSTTSFSSSQSKRLLK